MGFNNKKLDIDSADCNVFNKITDLYDKLDVDLYEKISAAKVSYKLKKPNTLITENLQYIVKHLKSDRLIYDKALKKITEK